MHYGICFVVLGFFGRGGLLCIAEKTETQISCVSPRLLESQILCVSHFFCASASCVFLSPRHLRACIFTPLCRVHTVPPVIPMIFVLPCLIRLYYHTVTR